MLFSLPANHQQMLKKSASFVLARSEAQRTEAYASLFVRCGLDGRPF